MIKKESRNERRIRRHRRVRKKVFGTPERPRLCVFRSNKHIYAQIIDDTIGHTLVSASTLDPELREKLQKTWNIEAAKEVGLLIVFDRGGYKYHGRVKALADGAREAGLEF